MGIGPAVEKPSPASAARIQVQQIPMAKAVVPAAPVVAAATALGLPVKDLPVPVPTFGVALSLEPRMEV